MFDRGFVTYSNAAKEAMLGVPPAVLDRHGAVSRETAEAMATGALASSQADIAVAITGIAGPGGGSAEKPVGLVHFACASREGARLHRERRFGDIGRAAVRRLAVAEALAMLENLATGPALMMKYCARRCQSTWYAHDASDTTRRRRRRRTL